MISFFIALGVLIIGYFTYSKVVEKVIKPTDEPTPAIKNADGVDYVPIGTVKSFLIQLINIAGLGPIYGPILGALWGPQVFLWIAFGSIFAGAVHDYLGGMISMRHNGSSISEVVGIYLGSTMKQVMRIFSVVLLVLCGTVFSAGPAALLSQITPLKAGIWMAIILGYYFLATPLPIDKVIGRFYPILGLVLIAMAISVIGGIFFQGITIPEIDFKNIHPQNAPVWPLMFVTVACGAISGFHATQSPIIARCCRSEKDGRKIFYGAMVAEGAIALVWAAAGTAFYNSSQGLFDALQMFKGPGGVVYDISINLLGPVGGVLALIGVIICPITSGDTAFRSARLTIADWFHIDQKNIVKRLSIAVPLLLCGVALSLVDYQIVWRYFTWSNQTLAMIALWASSVYLAQKKYFYWIALIPATFMSAVSATYLLQADEGFRLSTTISYPVGIIFAGICFIIFMSKSVFSKKVTENNL
ncbi:MAG: carbon starvation CstA family protein [Treponemataceae bacterium]